MEGHESRRRERAAQDKRLEGLAVDVLVAVAERDEAIRKTEQRAGISVRTMQGEGLSASEVAQWCGEAVSAREVRRLAQGVEMHGETVQDKTGPGVEPAPDDGPSASGQEQRTG